MSAARELEIIECASPVAEPVRRRARFLERRTIRKIMRHVEWSAPDESTKVLLDGEEVPFHMWNTLCPKDGSSVVLVRRAHAEFFAVVAAFFAGLGSGATAGTAVGGTIAVGGSAAAAGAVGVAFAAGAFIGGVALSVGVSVLVSKLIGGPNQDIDPLDGGPESPTLQGAGNAVRRNAPFPYVAGSFRFAPPFASLPFTTVRGGESVLTAAFITGLGRVFITDPLIGDVPLDNFVRAREFVRHSLNAGNPFLAATAPPTSMLGIYTNKVFQSGLNSAFDPIPFGSADYFSPHVQFRVPGQGHSRLGVDLNFPGGLAVLRDKGPRDYFFAVEIEYRQVIGGTPGAWQNAADEPDFGPIGLEGRTVIVPNSLIGQAIQYTGQTSRPFQSGLTWTIDPALSPGAEDEWDIRMRRVERSDPRVLPGGSETNTTFGTFIWFAIKGFNFRNPPLVTSGVATYEIEVPLDTQFNGLQNNLTVLVSRYYRLYDPTNSLASGVDADGWSNGYFLSSNPAAIIRDMLQGENNRRPVPNDKINIAALSSFYEYCRTYNDGGLVGGLRFDFVFDARMDLFEACNVVAQAGRGKFVQDSQGLFSVVFDGPKTTPVAKISAANCRDFRLELLMPRRVEAVRVQLIDAEEGFDLDAEIEVYNDGFSADGSGGTQVADENLFETLSLIGTTRKLQAFLLARYFLAEAKLRRRIFQVEMGLEHQQFGVGSLVTFSHPGALIGIAEGRIKSSSAAVYRDLFDRDQPPYANDPRSLTAATAIYGDATGPISKGEGAAEVTSTSTGSAIVATLFSLLGTLDFSSCRFDLDAMVRNLASLSTTDGIRVRFYGPTFGDWKEWRLGTNDGLNATTLATVGNTLASAGDATAGTYNPATTKSMEIYGNVVGGAIGRKFRYCNFRISRTSGAISEVEFDQSVPMTSTFQGEVEYRREVIGPSNDIRRSLLKRLADYSVTSDRLVRFGYLVSPVTAGTTEPLADQLYTFGPANVLVERCIVQGKEGGQDLTSRVTLVEEAPGVHSVAGTIPSFPIQSTLPVSITQIGPPAPNVLQSVSDERAILVLSDGTLKPRILIHISFPLVFGRPVADFLSVHYRRILPSTLQGIALPQIPITSEIAIDDVEEGATYEISVQAVSRDGKTSEPTIFQVLVEGKMGLPPDVQQFRLEGTVLRWTLPDAPPDLAGFKIKKGPVGGTFASARWITEPMLVAAPPFDVATIPDPGNATVYIVAVDTVGNESAVPATVTGFIGVPVAKNVVRTVDIDAAGFGIIDQVESIVSDFESFMKPATPTFALEPTQLPGEDPDPVQFLLTGLFDGTLDIERSASLIDVGMQSLKVQTSSGVTGPYVILMYAAPINVTKRKIQGRFRGGKAAVTWTVRYRMIQSDDTTKWSRWDVSGLGTLSYVNANVDLSTAATATNGGGCDLTKVGQVEVSTVCSSPAIGDFVHFDNLRWVGGTVNGVEVVSGDLKTMAVASNFWPEDLNANFWNTNLSADFWATTTYLDGIYEFEVEILSADLPGNVRIVMTPDPGVDFQIFYKLPSGTEFMPFPGVLILPVAGFYRFKILLAGGFVQGVIDQLAVIVDVEDQIEKIANFSVSNTGTVRLPITKTYRSITDILYTVRGTTPGIALFLDYVTTIGAGPSVQIVNSTTGARITASADFEVRGVKG